MKAKIKILVVLAIAAVVGIAANGTVFGSVEATRTIMKVQNLSCSACLSQINAELQGYDGMLGMDADLQKGLVVVEHKEPLTAATLAFVISDLGYPATVLSDAAGDSSLNDKGRLAAFGSGCGSGGCSIKTSTWQKVYQRYFGKK